MIKIYINNILQNAEILPANVPTKDETLETFSFALMANSNPLPLAPMQRVKVDFKGNGTEVKEFYIVSDSVETCCLKPLLYKHSISCIQNTRKLSKHMVRNSSFTQPFYLFKNSFNTEKRYLKAYQPSNVNVWRGEFGDYDSGDVNGDQTYYDELNYNSKKLELLENEKVTNASFKISFQYGACINISGYTGTLYANDHNAADMMEHVSGMEYSLEQHFTLKYTDRNGTSITRSLTPSDFGESSFDFNKTYNFPLIVELAKQGCNNFEVLFDTLDMLNGVNIAAERQVQWWMMQVQINVTVYYYNCYDILDLLLKRQRKTNFLNYENDLFALPLSGELYNLLKNTPAPNFTFTELTMYECVAEVFRVFDAIFTLEWNQTRQCDVLGIEYFNDLESDELPESTKFTGRNLALGEDKFTNGLVANYQDARVIEKFPLNGFAHLRSAEFGVPEPQDHNFIVPHNIDNVLKCEIIIDGFDFYYYSDAAHDLGTRYYGEMVVDITRYVLEQNVWSLLEEGNMTNSDYVSGKMKKTNCIYYAKGDNKIQCGFSFKTTWFFTNYVLQALVDTELVHLAAMHSHNRIRLADSGTNQTILKGDWKEIKMKAIYITTVDGKTKVHSITEKYPGETLVDQANGAVDLNKFGLNMLGLSLKLGNPTLNATHKIASWANRIRTGQLYNWQGKLWVANVVNYTFMGNGILQGKVSFVQNFNALSLRTQLLREKRMSNISRELVQKSEEILTDYIYFSSAFPEENGTDIHFNSDALQSLMVGTFKPNSTTHEIKDAFIYDPTKADVNNEKDAIYIPMIRYGAGNTINFEVSFDHPMNAGNKTTYSSGHYFTNHVVYTDERGFMERVSVIAPFTNPEFTQDFPAVKLQNADQLVNNSYFSIRDFFAYKQPNEIFALNYQLAFLPIAGRENTDFIGSTFINNNALVKTIDETTNARYIAFMAHKSSILDVKATNYFEKKAITNVNVANLSGYKFRINFIFPHITQAQYDDIVSWAIVDENDNILFASNTKNIYYEIASIFFMTKNYR